MSRSRAGAGVATAVLAGLLVVASSPPVGARDGDRLNLTTAMRFWDGPPHRVVLSGNLVYAALDTGLEVLDATDPANLVVLAHVYLPGPALDVAVQGDFAFVAAGEAGLFLIDITDPAAPIQVGSLPARYAQAVAVSGTVAYVGEASAAPPGYGLTTVDVIHPTVPAALGFVALPNGPLSVAIDGTTAWVGVGSDPGNSAQGLIAVDVGVPAAPALVAGGSLALGRGVNRISISAGTAYLAAGNGGLGRFVIADVATPASPSVLASIPLPDSAMDVAVVGAEAFIADNLSGLRIYDVAVPAMPVLLGALYTGRYVVTVAARPGIAVLGERSSTGYGAVSAADTSVPRSPVALGAGLRYADATAVTVAPGFAYLLRRDGLHIYDTTVAGPPSFVSSWTSPAADFLTLAVSGTLAAVAEGDLVRLVDLQDPANPVTAGELQVANGLAIDLVLGGGILYVATGVGLETWDVSVPSAPAPLGSLPIPSGWASALALDGTTGYLVATDSLHVLDLQTPSVPMEMAALAFPGEQLYGVAAAGPVAVVSGLTKLLYTVSVADPMTPQNLGEVTGGIGYDVELVSTKAFVAAAEGGIFEVDLASPDVPVVEGYFDTSGQARSVAISGTSLYLATTETQFWMLQCETPAPGIAANSLSAVKQPVDATFAWQVVGAGSCNLHRTLQKSDIAGLYADALTRIGTTGSLTLTDTFMPPQGECAFYQVYGADSCTGASSGPD